jgi:hypothetical protein
MPMLDELLKQSQPGVNPKLEDMIARLMVNGGATPGQTASGVQGLQGQQAPSTLGTGAAGVPAPAGAAQPMAPEEANLTYQALIRKGVPPQLAQQALANPKLLRDLLTQIYRQPGPQEAPQMLNGGVPARPTAPPLGGGGGYG